MEKWFCFHIRQKEGLFRRWRHHYIEAKAFKYKSALKKIWKHFKPDAELMKAYIEYRKR